MDELGLLKQVLPEVDSEMKGLPQGRPDAPNGDLWDHILRVIDELEGPVWPEPAPVSFPLAFAAILHDVGKKRTAGKDGDRYTFHGHEHTGKRMAAVIGRRMKLSNPEIHRIEWLVERHQYLSDSPIMRPSRLKPILVHPGIGELLALHRADAIASGHSLDHVEFCLRVLRETPPEILNPPPLLTGDDLIALGWEQGPKFKTALDGVREAQLEGAIQTKDQAIQLAQREYKND